LPVKKGSISHYVSHIRNMNGIPKTVKELLEKLPVEGKSENMRISSWKKPEKL